MYEGIETVVIAVIAGLLYGMTTFLHKEGQTFKLNKLIGTLVISALIGIGAASSGQEVTEDMIAMQLVVYAGAVMFVENLVKIYITKSDKLISTKGTNVPAVLAVAGVMIKDIQNHPDTHYIDKEAVVKYIKAIYAAVDKEPPSPPTSYYYD